MPGPRRVVGVIRSSAHAHGVGAHLRSSVSACGHGGSSARGGTRENEGKKRFWRRWAARTESAPLPLPLPLRRRGSTSWLHHAGTADFSGFRRRSCGNDWGLRASILVVFSSLLLVCCPLPSLPFPFLPFPPLPSHPSGGGQRGAGRVLHSSTARTPTTTTIEQEAGSVSRTSSGGGSATTTGQPQTQNTDMMSSEAARKSAAGGTSFLGVQSRTTRIVMACLALICLLYLTTQSSVSSAKSLTRSARLMRKPIDYTSAHSSCGRTDDDKMIVLVTGAAGFVGMHTSLTLKASGHGVLGLDNFNDYYPVPLKRARQKALLAAGTLHTHGRSPSLPCRPTQSHSHSHNLHSYSRRVRRGARSCGRGCLC